ncbi:VRR-NUC domain-containing protein [Roseimaritima ulvae]|uniref:VRR-NUC domain-containing protein n=1 Tax=Roseimaritima ulvae TaxID=980254 RepID=A0A5B9QZN7_9BACT|nr:VRR-NUC domain-containing protein [Roseimaritima ulvae]QEG43439.1 hypothetical protein UC8_54880 [Roseimaritima ulvae]
MLFEFTETRYDLEGDGNAELLMQHHYESQGYCVLNNTFAVVYSPATTKYPDSQEIVSRLFDKCKLASLRNFSHRLLLGEGVTNVAPGQPDLLLYRPDFTEAFFSEVKTGGDTLKTGQMVGISVITTFLGCRVEVARVNGPPRRYKWAWPGLVPLSPGTKIELQ